MNVGRYGGLVKVINSPFYIHCYNHILDLCLKDSIKNSKFGTKIISLLKSTSTFYRTSPKLTRELSRLGDVLQTKVLSFKPICETRWADSTENSIVAVVTNYEVVIQHLTNVVSDHATCKCTGSVTATAKGILKELLSYDVVFFLHAFADFITLISKTSKLLESSNINIVQSTDSIKKLKLNLLDFESSGQLICSNSKHLESFLLSIK